MSSLRFLLFSLLLSFFSWPAFAQDIYKWIDSEGKVYFSNQPRSASDRPAKLPEIQREDIDRRIQKLEEETPKNCFSHGGVDCSAGADADGSVICLDGYREAVLPFRFSCLEAKLVFQEQTWGDELEEEEISVEKLQKNQLRVSFRNSSDVEAFDVQVRLFAGRRQLLALEGPQKVGPYGIAEYTSAPLDVDRREKGLWLKLSCANCRTQTKRLL